MTATLAPGKTIVSAVISETQRDKLLTIARAGDRSLSAEIRRAVTAHLERTTPEHQEPAP